MPESILNSNTLTDRLAVERRTALVAAVVLTLLALVMYRPWAPRPFDILDFSEFYPLLRDHDGFLSRLTALTAYYVDEHARLNLASYAGLALKWSLFGTDVVAWQWARFMEMLAIVLGAFLLLRKLTIGHVGAVAGASLLIVARPVSDGWTRLTMGEPLGLLAMLGALWLAIGWRDTPHERARAIGAGVLALIAVLAKEMLAGLLPFLWLLGTATGPDGRLGRPRLDAAARRWLTWAVLLPLVGFLAAFALALKGGSQSFTSIYGESTGGIAAFVRLIARPWLIQGTRPALVALILPANTVFLALVVVGTIVGWRDPARRAHLSWALIAAGGLSLALAVLYIPWPYFNLYYTIPFLLGPALLLGLAVDALGAGSALRRGATLAAYAAMVAVAAPSPAHTAAFNLALQRVNGDLVTLLPRYAGSERIVLAVRERAPLDWTGTGPTLRRHALATGVAAELPDVADRSCQEVGDLLRARSQGAVLLTYHHLCGPFPAPDARIAYGFRYAWITWAGGGIERDSIAVDVIAFPAVSPPPPAP